ncbi:hypothetical protein CO154_00370 [Candidatus Pacearchaeota archaeon CG_4_9_14_3_um_filter_31_7]|nr:MAG: hypothetical protein AUJ10_01565 [Candidatus Pacearchaeota archaeon CG1_02_31_27]PIN92634.1 MAG: hypothetical protein COU55_00460 [Candidatus Pacearchaeota archaeon CG10_big_fil_rev_8_21_14_0_10_31_59]PIZ81183.1 MAG: hypothetical protein COX99_00340 [Candidatus Pacearchaeota archaeon CG_4_10_14_0_2_um_filter_31_10]PJA70929.1 MAG: hypothetical protein CO154_00370 [Candidatus Pacearchaeota archaeon CG_4_9_14_3_um_filter_31_7]
MKKEDKVGQEEFYNMITGNEVSWQALILELINSEQLDPWDIDLTRLTDRYLKKIVELQEHNFFVSSKLLLAAALLLRIKSEMLHSSIKDIDEILFGSEDKKGKEKEIIEIDDDELPIIMPRTPLPRLKKVTLQQLIDSLNRAMNTEQRRIRRDILLKRIADEANIVLPKRKVDILAKIKEIYQKIKAFLFEGKKAKMTFTDLAGSEREERIATFVPLLHLTNQERVELEQEIPFEEIYITLRAKKIIKPEETNEEPQS